MKENIVKLTLADKVNVISVNLSNVSYVQPIDDYFVIHFVGTDNTISVIDNPFPHLV